MFLNMLPNYGSFTRLQVGEGGYRDLLKRPSMEKVLKDVKNGFFSVEKTKEQYEVVTDLILFKTPRKKG
jgi:N-methylhydantoinase B/oxoprolinase/acetone carboxylase alpha subunit